MVVDRASFVIILATVSSTGCLMGVERVALTRASSDFNCDESLVTLKEIGGTSYKASGCRKTQIYNCAVSDRSAGDYVCIPQSDSPQIERKSP
jgi:hypothetical protein